MGHIHHRHQHAHPRDAPLEQRQVQNGVATVFDVVYVTASKTFDGPAVWVTQGNQPPPPPAPSPQSSFVVGAPLQNTRAQNTVAVGTPIAHKSKTTPPTETTPKTKTTPSPSSKAKPSRKGGKTNVASTTSASTKSSNGKSSTSLPLAGAASPNSTSSSTAAAISGDNTSGSGLSGGVAAGLAIGLIGGIALIAGLVFLVYRRKKRSAGLTRLDDEKTMNEKPAPPIPTIAPVASRPVTPRSATTAPRLSLRPLTQFSPDLGDDAGHGGNKPQVASNGLLAPTAQPASNMRGPQSNVDPANPFGIHAEKAQPATPEPAPVPTNEALRSETLAGKVPESGRVTPPEPPRPKSPAGASFMSTFSEASNAYTEVGDVPPMGPVAAGGIAPPPTMVHRVQLDFIPTMDDELEVRAGQLVRVLHNYDDGWALCIRMDRSQQGVVPRSCLSKHPLKPRQPGPPRNRAPPPGMRGPPPFAGPPPRPLSPGGRNSPVPYGGPPRPASPAHQNGRARSRSNAPSMGPPRSMSPGPYGGGHQRPQQPQMRRRSNSVGDLAARRISPPGPSPLSATGSMPLRKPVPGQAM